jgi:hypothetical protein
MKDFANEDHMSMFGWLVADGWCWFVLKEEYCWLVAGGWFVLREKYCWLVADKRSEQGGQQTIGTTARSDASVEEIRMFISVPAHMSLVRACVVVVSHAYCQP